MPGIRSLNWDGRAVVVGFAGGGIPKIPANILLVKNVEVSGLYWGASAVHNPTLFMKSSQEVITMWLKGTIKPHVSHRVPLADANTALDIIKSRKSTGKVLLV
jgi:NADPH2:quinone reductase